MDGTNSSVDLTQLLQVIQAQVQASSQRDTQLQTLLQAMTPNSTTSGSGPSVAPHKVVAVERPTLLASATLADFTSWSEAWDDYARCQLLSSQPHETRMAAFRQALDEDLRRFIHEGVISIPSTHDVPQVMDELRAFIRRQRNPLLDRIEFYRRSQHPGETFDSWYTSLRELFHACNFSGISLCSTCTGRWCDPCTQSLPDVADEILRDRIVTGILSDDVRHKLLTTKDLPSSLVLTCAALRRLLVTHLLLYLAMQVGNLSVQLSLIIRSRRSPLLRLLPLVLLPRPAEPTGKALAARALRLSAQTVVAPPTRRIRVLQPTESATDASVLATFCQCVRLPQRKLLVN